MIRHGTDEIALGILRQLKTRHGNADTSTTVEVRQDVYHHLFAGKGRPSGRRGYIDMEKDDFSRCNFPENWDRVADNLGDGKKVVFPIRMRHFLSWGHKTYNLVNQTLVLAMRYHQEKLSICFASTAFSVN